METLTTVIFAMCLSKGASNYDWRCVDFMNNCAVHEKSESGHKKIEECVERWKDGERYKEPEQ